MGVFSRLTDIVNSNLNALLATAENPERMVRLMIQEMEDTLVEVRSQTVQTIAERRELERRVETQRREEAEWQRKAELALTRDREDLAKGALQARHHAGQQREAMERQLAQLVAGLDAQSADIGRLQAKLADARGREKSLASRGRIAGTRLKVRASLHDRRVADAFDRFEQVERRLDEAEGQVEAFDIGRGRDEAGGTAAPSLAEALAGLEAEASVDDELAELKRRLGNRLPAKGGSV